MYAFISVPVIISASTSFDSVFWGTLADRRWQVSEIYTWCYIMNVITKSVMFETKIYSSAILVHEIIKQINWVLKRSTFFPHT